MGDSTFGIDIFLGHILPGQAPLDERSFPALAYAVRKVVDAGHRRWQEFASGAPMPSGEVIKNRTGEYLRSIQSKSTGPFAGEIFTVLPYAHVIEEGGPARDLKKMLDSSFKVRISKTGKRYLIIPFRHNNPKSLMGNNMPAAVWNWWKQDHKLSAVIGSQPRVSGTGALDIKTRGVVMVPGWRYNWGTRLTSGDLGAMGFAKDDKTAKRLEGMVHFRAPQSKGGGQFINFRVMVEGSSGWRVGPTAGKHPAAQVAKEMRTAAEPAFARAVEIDIARILGGEVT